MLYCVNCGQLRIKSASKCHNCGKLLDLSGGQPTSGATDSGVNAGTVPWRGGQVVLGIVLVVVSIVPVGGILIGIDQSVGGIDEALATWLSVHLLGLAIIGVVWRIGLKEFNAPFSSIGLTAIVAPRFKTMLMTLAVLGTSLLVTVVYGALIDLIDSDALSPPDDYSELIFSGLAVVLSFQALAVATPVVEEVFFRGFVYSGLVPRLGVGWAMVTSAMVFSMFHIVEGAWVLMPIFITGLLLAWLYQRTGSLWPSIVAHAGQNALVVGMEVFGV